MPHTNTFTHIYTRDELKKSHHTKSGNVVKVNRNVMLIDLCWNFFFRNCHLRTSHLFKFYRNEFAEVAERFNLKHFFCYANNKIIFFFHFKSNLKWFSAQKKKFVITFMHPKKNVLFIIKITLEMEFHFWRQKNQVQPKKNNYHQKMQLTTLFKSPSA